MTYSSERTRDVEMPRFIRRRNVLRLAAVLLALAAGCGESTDRLHLHGEITYRGQPLEQGHITFLTTGPSSGPVCGAVIRDGKFDIPTAKGLKPGAYRVAISSPGGEAPQTPEEIAAGASARALEMLPPKYNGETTLTAEVTAAGPNQFDFHLE
ncbi:MAG: hypothetical protein KDA42_19000 [Planctomycetales bacterium]|nr:hypothetical protein [Planctomycetales bacterium]